MVAPFQGVGGSNRSGSVLVFLANVFTNAGVEWHEVPISPRSYEYSPSSSFTACVHEVAIGNVDMCWGNFWPTATRRALTMFTGSMYSDNFHVIVPMTTAKMSLWDSFTRPFEPFSAGLWMFIFGAFGFVGFTVVHANTLTEEHARPGQSRADREAERAKKRRRTLFDTFPLLFSSVVKGMHALNTGEVKGVDVKTGGSWLAQFLVGLTKTVLVAVYTSLTVSSLLTQGNAAFMNLEEGIDGGYTFCANSAMRSVLEAEHPRLGPLLVDKSNHEVLNGVIDGECDAALAHTDLWEKVRLWGDHTFCNTMTRLPETVTVAANAIPVNPKIIRAVSALMGRDIEAGNYPPIAREAKRNYTGNLCREQDVLQQKSRFEVADIAGFLTFLMIGAAACYLVNIFNEYLHKKHMDLQAAIDLNGDGKVTVNELARYGTRVRFARTSLSRSRETALPKMRTPNRRALAAAHARAPH